MEWCVEYPKEQILVVRPSLRKACGENRNAAKFLSYLLYMASYQEVQIGKEMTKYVVIRKTQKQVVREMDEEISTRTLRDEAIPCLVELGYLDYEETKGDKQYTAYTIYPDKIQRGINFPDEVPHYKTLPYTQNKSEKKGVRKNFRTEKLPNGAEEFPNGSEKLHTESGKISAPKSADEAAPEAAASGEFQEGQSFIENILRDRTDGDINLDKNDEITKAAIEVCQSLNADKYVYWLNDDLHTVYTLSQAHLPLFLKEVEALAETFKWLAPTSPEEDIDEFIDRLYSRYGLKQEQTAEAGQA